MTTEIEPKMTYAEALQKLIERCKAEVVHNAQAVRAAKTKEDDTEGEEADLELTVDILDWLENHQAEEQVRIDQAVTRAKKEPNP